MPNKRRFKKKPCFKPLKTDRARAETTNQLKIWQRQKPDRKQNSLDQWQELACQYLADGYNVIIDAPTSAGKTRIVEHFFNLSKEKHGFRAAYTTPVKSLSNDKLMEFRELYGKDQVGISTGDFKENLNAPLVVATLESYRNSLLGIEPDLNRSLVVFDEYHYMQDEARGSAWEEAIILTPPHCQILLLSASVKNPGDFRNWIADLSPKKCKVVSTEKRPVPLKNMIYLNDQWLLEDTVPIPVSKPRHRNKEQIRFHPLLQSIAKLTPLGLTPSIIYAGRRAACEDIAHQLPQYLKPLPSKANTELKQLLKEHLPHANLKLIRGDLVTLITKYGVSYHHSGLTPQARIAIEQLIKQGKLHFCIATMGLSLGINFSVKSTMVSDFSRPGDSGFIDYRPSEILQMSGRAGRRGLDTVGLSLWPAPASFWRFSKSRRESCHSRLKSDPATLLGLIGRPMNLKDIEIFYQKSFMKTQNRAFSPKLIRKDALEITLKSHLPCRNPIISYTAYRAQKPSTCLRCPLRKACHQILKPISTSGIGQLQTHLTDLGCFIEENILSSMGTLGRFFPQNGGLVIAFLVNEGLIHENNLLHAVEVMGSLSLAHYKSPKYSGKLLSSGLAISDLLSTFYPKSIFPGLYDINQNHQSCFREYNPKAGGIVRSWAEGIDWSALVKKSTSKKFSQGDLISLISRSMTYLHSLTQAQIPKISAISQALRASMQREPIAADVFSINKEENLNELP